jgi:uncharacterized protein
MKFLIVILVIGVFAWLLVRGNKAKQPTARTPAREPGIQDMVRCVHCGVHLPRGDALLDHRGAFCSPAHQVSGPDRE